jgi:hypothetical protein
MRGHLSEGGVEDGALSAWLTDASGNSTTSALAGTGSAKGWSDVRLTGGPWHCAKPIRY